VRPHHLTARQRYPLVKYTEKDLYTIAALTASFKVDGHRADIVILKTARAQAAYDGRLQISDKDILLAAELALPHRMKKQPFQDSVLNPDQLQSNMRQARAEAEQSVPDEDQQQEGEGKGTADEKKAPRAMSRS
jgi:Mg-chelatase subunit ChlI